MGETSSKNVLESIGLGFLITRFEEQKIEMINNLTDRELLNLGIETIGDRARLRRSTQHIQTPPVTSTDAGSSSGTPILVAQTKPDSMNHIHWEDFGADQHVHCIPMMVHLFTPQTTPLTVRMLSTLIRPQFSIDGSNQRMLENTTYQLFVKYLREAAAGRRPGVGLNHLLRFVTGADEEPVLGFAINPSLHFVQSLSFLPTSSTCANRLNLTVPGELPMPSTQELFNLVDYAFLNSYFGFE